MGSREIYFPIDKATEMGEFVASITREGLAYEVNFITGQGWYFRITGF